MGQAADHGGHEQHARPRAERVGEHVREHEARHVGGHERDRHGRPGPRPPADGAPRRPGDEHEPAERAHLGRLGDGEAEDERGGGDEGGAHGPDDASGAGHSLFTLASERSITVLVAVSALPQLPARPALRPAAVRSERVRLADGARTTVHVAEHALERTAVRVVRLPTAPVAAWARRAGVADALVGGFFLRAPRGGAVPLGEVRTSGIARRSVAFDAPWGSLRAAVHVVGDRVAIDRRPELPAAPPGDLLQAGPLLVRHGAVAFDPAADHEGFSAGARQFDSDITAGRHPRAALAVTADRRVLAVACDGRADDEAGLTLGELAEALVALGARSALTLDGGGSTSLVAGGERVNVPREGHGVGLPAGRPVPTALTFTPR